MTTNQSTKHIMQFFTYNHLPPELATVSLQFKLLADYIYNHVPTNPEKTVALRKLLEAKDAAVRAKVAEFGGRENNND